MQCSKKFLWTDVYTYNTLSNVTSHTDARGVKTNYSYINPAFSQIPIDPLNRILSVSFDVNGAPDLLSSPTVNSGYQPTGNISKMKSITAAGVSTVEFDHALYGVYTPTMEQEHSGNASFRSDALFSVWNRLQNASPFTTGANLLSNLEYLSSRFGPLNIVKIFSHSVEQDVIGESSNYEGM